MRTSLLRTSGLSALLVLSAGILVLSSVQGDGGYAAAPPGPGQGVSAWTRVLEPAIIAGDGLPQFDGVSLDALFVYAFTGTAWEQVPFQIDEVDAGGAYATEDGLLDANDELVFMAMDLGQQANPSQWLEDIDSQNYVRYEVTVTDPLNPAEQGWVYVYRSATLVPAFADYVEWDAGNNRIVGGTYIVGFEPETHAGTDSLELNNTGIDVLDRGKLRVNVTCWIGPFPVELTLTEEDLAGEWGVTPSIDGAVRVGGGSVESYSWSYHSLYGGKLLVDVEGFEPPDPCTDIDINWLRASSDWLDPSGTGMAPASYYDDNTPDGVPIDGAPDAVPPSPGTSYQQVSGSRGSLVQVMDIQLGGGTVTNYYKDDDTLDPGDTGEDQRSYGDAGYLVEAPTGEAAVGIDTFILDPSQPNVGAVYAAYRANPLVVDAAAQSYEPPCDPVSGTTFGWVPAIPEVGEEVTFAADASGTPPITFEWDFGDGTAGTGEEVMHSYDDEGSYTVVLLAANACGEEMVSDVLTVVCSPPEGIDFFWEPDIPPVQQVVTFTAEAEGTAPITYDWAFGDDGSTQAGNPVTHSFALSGTFPVTLTASNPCGTAAPVTRTIEVVEWPPGYSTYLPMILRTGP